MEDAGYYTMRLQKKHGITPIIPSNLHGEKEPPEEYASNRTPEFDGI
jgi:hypothetical protein